MGAATWRRPAKPRARRVLNKSPRRASCLQGPAAGQRQSIILTTGELGLCAWQRCSVFGYLVLAYSTGRIDYTAIAHTLTHGSDNEYDGQEEAARIEAHSSFAAVLGRRYLVLSGDRYLCIL